MIKKVGSCWYVHKSNYMELSDAIREKSDHPYFEIAINYCDKYFSDYQIIKYDSKKHTVSCIESPDWDTSYEPIVGDSIITYLDTSEVKHIKGKANPQVYHHKWMFVADDYTGFNIEKAKERSALLFSIPNFNTKEVKSRIGYKNYWDKWCKENGILY